MAGGNNIRVFDMLCNDRGSSSVRRMTSEIVVSKKLCTGANSCVEGSGFCATGVSKVHVERLEVFER